MSGGRRNDGGGPSAQRHPAAAARSKAWRGNAWSGQAPQDGVGWRLFGFLAPGSRDGWWGKAREDSLGTAAAGPPGPQRPMRGTRRGAAPSPHGHLSRAWTRRRPAPPAEAERNGSNGLWPLPSTGAPGAARHPPTHRRQHARHGDPPVSPTSQAASASLCQSAGRRARPAVSAHRRPPRAGTSLAAQL
jgi:hypothetical protein